MDPAGDVQSTEERPLGEIGSIPANRYEDKRFNEVRIRERFPSQKFNLQRKLTKRDNQITLTRKQTVEVNNLERSPESQFESGTEAFEL